MHLRSVALQLLLNNNNLLLKAPASKNILIPVFLKNYMIHIFVQRMTLMLSRNASFHTGFHYHKLDLKVFQINFGLGIQVDSDLDT
ncbi:hypothetical protein BpHYR1_040793 [Brachionus plicatilis]|uniref:Uncharacterized protein n=1 Tax=Brachionus plicatilis TaxID=10195 RepID=A0A3M7SW88_BRAPC|nr:hypothetical protein BpHYR1_040793 [Brachionus plicatilis]